jgi:hypothetical protein
MPSTFSYVTPKPEGREKEVVAKQSISKASQTGIFIE